MVQFRFCTGSPGRFRVLVAGAALAATAPAFAASSATDPLDSAIQRELSGLRPGDSRVAAVPASGENTGEPRRLPEVQVQAIQKVSSEQPPVPPPMKPQPTAAQLEVMKQLEDMYQRDGREMPSMRIKDAPNTYLPKGQVVKPVSERAITAASASTSQSGSLGVPPAPSPAASNSERESKRGFMSLFTRRPSSGTQKKTSLFSRFTRSRSQQTVANDKKEGLLGKLLSPFKKDHEQTATPQFVPTPPPLPEEYSPPSFAERTSEPRLLQPATNQTYESPSMPRVAAAPSASANGSVREREPNPFAEVMEVSTEETPKIVIRPAQVHPFENPFSAIEGEEAPDLAFVSAIDPEFADVETADTGVVNNDAPRTLDPESVAETDDFSPPRLDAPSDERADRSAGSSAGRYAELQRKLAERAGLGGFQGFCPVALRDKRELIDSRPEFLSVYRGRTYELSTAEAKARFEANPSKYAPVSGGNDVVLMARGETDAQGNLNHAVWFKDQLYLFRTSDTVREFNSEPSKYAVTE